MTAIAAWYGPRVYTMITQIGVNRPERGFVLLLHTELGQKPT